MDQVAQVIGALLILLAYAAGRGLRLDHLKERARRRGVGVKTILAISLPRQR